MGVSAETYYMQSGNEFSMGKVGTGSIEGKYDLCESYFKQGPTPYYHKHTVEKNDGFTYYEYQQAGYFHDTHDEVLCLSSLGSRVLFK